MTTNDSYLNKPYNTMTGDEVRQAHTYWSDKCATAPGWPSAYFAAKQLAHCQRQSNQRHLGLINNHKIITRRDGPD